MKTGKALTWNELANDYDKYNKDKPARTLPMDKIFKWAENQSDKYFVSSEGTIHRIIL